MRKVRLTVIDDDDRAEKTRRDRREAGIQFLALIGIAGAVIAAVNILSDGNFEEVASRALKAAMSRTATANLLAGQALRISNSSNVQIRIQSEYPITIAGSDCRAFHEVEVTLDCGASDILITDFRPSIFITARANRVTYTITER